MKFLYNPFTRQLDIADSGTGPNGPIDYIAGNSGGNVGPDDDNVISLVGSGGVTVVGTPASNQLVISTSTEGTSWTDEAVSFNAAVGNGYFITANATATLPAVATQGQVIMFNVVASATTLIIQANTGQLIRISNGVSSSAGTLTNTAEGDSIYLIYRSATTTWQAQASIGTWNTA